MIPTTIPFFRVRPAAIDIGSSLLTLAKPFEQRSKLAMEEAWHTEDPVAPNCVIITFPSIYITP